MPRQKFVENINLTSDTYFEQKKVEESTKSITVNEATGSNTYQALAVYTFPISRPDQRNLNNRIYSSELWENVIRSGKAEGTFGLMDHPESEGSVKDIWCVWRNLRFSQDRKLILCDAYLFGKWGHQVLEALQAGGKVGLSSSGWGDFLPDNTTLDPETYEIERPADFVLNPSYEVFGVQDDLIESIKKESTLENSPKDHIKENKRMEEKILEKTSPSLEERNFRLNIRNMFKEARKISNIEERINECKTLLGYFGRDTENDLYKEIEESITKDNNEIFMGFVESSSLKQENSKLSEDIKTLNEQIEAVKKEKESLEKEKNSLQEQLDNACTLLDSMKEFSEKQDEMLQLAKAEKNGMVPPSEYKEALVFAEEKEEEAKKLKRQVVELRRKIEALQEAEDDDDEEKEDDEPEEKEEKKSRKTASKKSEDEDEDEDDEEDETDDDEDDDDVEDKEPEEKEEKKKDKKESRINPEVREYYEDLEYRNPKVVKIKEEILSRRTLLEAQKTYLKLRALVEDTDYRVYKSGKKTYVESTKKNPAPLHEGWV